ncbi:MAG: InlB B-repeat-containing protein [Coriobacteriales bacterium]|nr:InlB B-repeat-containing protein [Coriobacteriales bacterium]
MRRGGGGISSTAQAANRAYEIDLHTTGTASVQSTIEIPIALDGSFEHGSSVYLLCIENGFGTTEGTLVAPLPLKEGAVGFALASNPEPSKKNTVINGFGEGYAPAKNTAPDNRLWAALPSGEALLFAQSTDGAQKGVSLYLSAKASPATPAGRYAVKLRIETSQNFTFDFDSNGGDGTVTDFIVPGQPIPVPGPEEIGIERVGYHFREWNSRPDGSGTPYLPGENLVPGKDSTLYAQWEPNEYTVEFEANAPDATEPVPPFMVVTFDDPYGPLPESTRPGYDLEEWNTEADGTGDGIEPGDTVKITEDSEFYAQWEEEDYTVSFNKNTTDTVSGLDPLSKPVTYGSPYGTLPAPSRTGYDFEGWNTAPDGSGASITGTSIVATSADQTLYAIWEPKTYTLTFDKNTADTVSGLDPSAKQVTFDDAYGILPDPERAGYNFDGWNSEPDASGTTIGAGDTVAITADTELYAIWSPKGDVDVTYYQNHDDLDTTTFTDEDRLFASAYTVPSLGGITDFSAPTGYHLDYWSTVRDGSGQTYEPGDDIDPLGYGVSLYAQWEADTYTVSFDVNGGDGPAPADQTVTYDDTYGTLPTPSRIGYDFEEWNTEADGSGTPVTATTSVTITAPQTLYAQWKSIEALIFTVQTTTADEDFAVSTAGYSATGTVAPYDWDINWGDSSAPQQESDPTAAGNGATNIPHTYTTPGTYTIIITPHDTTSPFQWARAFSVGSVENRAKIQEVVHMPAKGFLQSATETGDDYLHGVWAGCENLTRAVTPDASDYAVQSVGLNFMHSTWYGCTSLIEASIPDNSSWEVTSLGEHFMVYTWRACTSLTSADLPDTSSWRLIDIPASFMFGTWEFCSDLTTAVVPDTSDWGVSGSVGGSFLNSTWEGCTSLTTPVVPDTSGWTISGSVGTYFMNRSWGGSGITEAVVPDTSGWTVSGSVGRNFLSFTWTSCPITEAVVPDTSGWTVANLDTTSFLERTWQFCTSLTEAAVPDTSNWSVSGNTGDGFLYGTWGSCTSLTEAVVPETGHWNITGTIMGGFMRETWNNCTSLTSPVMIDTTNWMPTNAATYFMEYTWNNCPSFTDLSFFTLGNGFKSLGGAVLINQNHSWWHTFYVSTPVTDVTPQPTFADGTLITSLGTPYGSGQTFTNRTGMEGYDGLAWQWK